MAILVLAVKHSPLIHRRYDTSDDVIVKDPDILGGTPVFRGTRVPLQALFDSIEGGETLEEFLEGSVSRDMAVAALQQARHQLAEIAATNR